MVHFLCIFTMPKAQIIVQVTFHTITTKVHYGLIPLSTFIAHTVHSILVPGTQLMLLYYQRTGRIVLYKSVTHVSVETLTHPPFGTTVLTISFSFSSILKSLGQFTFDTTYSCSAIHTSHPDTNLTTSKVFLNI